MYAAQYGNFSLIKYLFEEKDCCLNRKNKDGASVSHLSAISGDKMLIQYLQEEGISIDERDLSGQQPLDIAKASNNKEVADYLEELYEILAMC